MHTAAYGIMFDLIKEYAPLSTNNPVCYDVGSFDVNGTFKNIVRGFGFEYIGLDIEAGKNVDKVISTENPWDMPKVDLVISGNCLEHVERPWEWVIHARNILEPDGILIISAPFIWAKHRHPIDCWRFLPDGLTALFNYAELEPLHTKLIHHGPLNADCVGVAKK